MSALSELQDGNVSGFAAIAESPRSLDHDGPVLKRRRTSIARHACERCRRKKSRCDEEYPCGHCTRSGATCQYGRRRPTKAGTDTSAVLNALQRLEARLDGAVRPVEVAEDISTSIGTIEEERCSNESTPLEPAHGDGASHRDLPQAQPSEQRVAGPHLPVPPGTASESAPTPYTRLETQEEAIPFSAYSILFWPAVQAALPNHAKSTVGSLDQDTPLLLESLRPPLAPMALQHTHSPAENWLSQLTVTAVNQLCDAFLSTFNLAYPVIEREFFYQHTLSAAIFKGFDYDLESCLVLVVMGLGCSGLKSLLKRGMITENWAPEALRGVHDEISGLIFFNEARRRIGFVTCDSNIQSCQYYLLAGMFYANLTRPMESWAMISRASLCLTAHWEREAKMDDWEKDMHSRLYWIAVMFENIIGAEFNLPATKLQDLTEQVNLPRFVQYESSQSSFWRTSNDNDKNSFYHYHFLSQVAHRIMLSRIHSTLFYSTHTGSYPSEALEDELYHQLRAWRDQLPDGLRFDDQSPIMQADSPRTVLVASWLPARYYMARYHVGRPHLSASTIHSNIRARTLISARHKLLHRPRSIGGEDTEKCRMIVEDILAWLPYAKITLSMQDCLPLKFTMTSHIFSQFLTLFCLKNSPNSELRESLPATIYTFCADATEILNNVAPESPTIAMYARIATELMANLPQ